MNIKNENIYFEQKGKFLDFQISEFTNCNKKMSKLGREYGSALTILITTVAGFFLYLKFLHNYLEVNIHTLFASLVMIILAVACMFALIHFVTSLIRGDRSNSSIKKEILNELDMYDQVVIDSQSELRKYEDNLSDNRIVITAKGLEAITLIRKIIAALKDRSYTVRSLLSTNSDLAFVQAVETMNSNFLAKENSFLTIVTASSSEEDPELQPEKILPVIRNLFEQVSTEIETATSKVSAKI